MQVPDLVGLFVGPLEALEIPYMVTGGVASVIYGDPRFTRDIDIVLGLEQSDAARFANAFAGGEFYVPPLEVLRREARRRVGHFNVIHRDTSLRADVYTLGDDPLHVWGIGRRKRLELEDGGMWVAPIEYVIVRKLQYHRESGSDRHLRDVAFMARISSEEIDRGALDRWLEEEGLQAEWAAAQALPT